MIDQKNQSVWNNIAKQYQISDHQKQQFEKYVNLLLQENEKYNLTAIIDVESIFFDHFVDSIAITKLHDLSSTKLLIDVGSGAGFPGIPLAIMLPEIFVCLIEVNLKKVHFLNLVIAELGLQNVLVTSNDWRTFLRTSSALQFGGTSIMLGQQKELVIARASLQVDELLRMFKPSSVLQKGTLVYWASKKWVPTTQEKEYLDSCVEYQVGQKERKLCFFKIK